MADFNAQLSEPTAAGSGVIAPTRPLPSVLEGVGSVVSMFAKSQANRQVEEQNAYKQSVLSGYSEDISAINEQLRQGTINPARAEAEIRKTNNKYLASAPQFAGDFDKVFSMFKGTTEVGDTFEQQKAIRDENNNLLKEAIKEGAYVPEGSDPALVEGIIANQRRMARTRQQIKDDMDMLALRKAGVETDDKVRDSRLRNEGRQLLKNLGSDKYAQAVDQVNLWIDEASTAGPEKRKELEISVNNFFSGVLGPIAIMEADAPNEAGAFRKLFEDQKELALKAVRGELSREMAENSLQQGLSMAAYIAATNDPRVASTAVMGKLFPQAAQDILTNITAAQDLATVLDRNGGLLNLKAETYKDVLNGVKDVSKKVANGEIKDAGEEMTVADENLIRSWTSSKDKTPSMQMDILKHIGSNDWRVNNIENGKIDSVVAEQGRAALQTFHQQTILPSITRKLAEPLENGVVGDFVNIEFKEGRVVFSPRITVGADRVLDPTAKREAARQAGPAVEMNKLSDALTTFLRASAHLSDTDDYRAYWEENRHVIMPTWFPSPSRIQKAKDDGFEYVGGYPLTDQRAWRKVNEQSVGE